VGLSAGLPGPRDGNCRLWAWAAYYLRVPRRRPARGVFNSVGPAFAVGRFSFAVPGAAVPGRLPVPTKVATVTHQGRIGVVGRDAEEHVALRAPRGGFKWLAALAELADVG
jgi:hypothetical protein